MRSDKPMLPFEYIDAIILPGKLAVPRGEDDYNADLPKVGDASVIVGEDFVGE